MSTQILNRSLALPTAAAALGGLLLGFDTAVRGTTQALRRQFSLTPATLGITVSCAIRGTVIGGLLAAVPAERLGPRESLRITAGLYLLSALGCARVDLGARFSDRASLPVSQSQVAPYSARCTSPRRLPRRFAGGLVACFQLSVVSGMPLLLWESVGMALPLTGVAGIFLSGAT